MSEAKSNEANKRNSMPNQIKRNEIKNTEPPQPPQPAPKSHKTNNKEIYLESPSCQEDNPIISTTMTFFTHETTPRIFFRNVWKRRMLHNYFREFNLLLSRHIYTSISLGFDKIDFPIAIAIKKNPFNLDFNTSSLTINYPFPSRV